MSFFKKNKNKGFAILEVVVATGVILLIVVSAYAVNVLFLRISVRNPLETKAVFLEEEGVEAIRIMRDTSWDNNIATLTGGTTYYFYYNNTTWVATTTKSFIDGTFERSFTLSAVSRDSGGDIVTSGGTNDTGSRKVTINVSWFAYGATTTRSTATYITNIF